MKKSIELTIALLEKAIKTTPDKEFNIKSRLKSILKIAQTKTNKENKETPLEKWRLDLETSQIIFSNPLKLTDAQEVLKKLEKMIAKEENKIKEEDKNNEETGTVLG